MKYMLDTNTLIYFIKNKPPSFVERIHWLRDEDELCLSLASQHS